MTTLTRESVAALSGRELDAAVAEKVLHIIIRWGGHNHDVPMTDSGYGPILTEYSHPDCRGLAEMIAATRERGLSIQIRDGAYRKGNSWAVTLTDKSGWAHIAPGSTIPEAFARALLLATLEAAP